MKITFLGTGTSQGVPVIGCGCVVCISLDFRDKRLRSSIHIKTTDTSIVIDTGPDFRQQVLREHITRLDGVLFTHAHRDHTAGLDDIRAFNFIQNMSMPVYGTTETLNQLKKDFAYIFGPKDYPGLPQISLHEIDETPFIFRSLHIMPLPVFHFKMPVFGFRIGTFSYITDCNHIPEQTLEKLNGTETLVLNALQHEQHISHFNLEQAIQMVEIIKPKQAYFTHISHKLGLHAEVSKQLPDNIKLAFDGLSLELGA
ncbi:MAG: MBL fold metallo-hydrolase [Cyclobacteriaceae bacterium]|nr:MBL fold metallo-hydrolase [Cyclobacteriaceae bacterium]